MGKFDAFKRYIAERTEGEVFHWEGNRFVSIGEDKVVESEEKLGFRFPDGLRQFYLEIGRGQIVCPASDPDGPPQTDLNTILDPALIVAMYLNDESEMPYEGADEETREWLDGRYINAVEEGELPFFEIGDGYFLVTRPHSDLPEAISHSGDHEPVAGDMVEFMERLHADPLFY